MSDVFPTSCPDIDSTLLTGVGDFAGPVQSMNFVVAIAATHTTISAEAAYLTFGLGAAGKTDWDNPDLYAIRNFQSGTETMLAQAINVPTNKWKGVDKGGSGGVITAVSGATNPDKTIGILASTEADVAANRLTIKRLAFQPYGETCAAVPGFVLRQPRQVQRAQRPVPGLGPGSHVDQGQRVERPDQRQAPRSCSISC